MKARGIRKVYQYNDDISDMVDLLAKSIYYADTFCDAIVNSSSDLNQYYNEYLKEKKIKSLYDKDKIHFFQTSLSRLIADYNSKIFGYKVVNKPLNNTTYIKRHKYILKRYPEDYSFDDKKQLLAERIKFEKLMINKFQNMLQTAKDASYVSWRKEAGEYMDGYERIKEYVDYIEKNSLEKISEFFEEAERQLFASHDKDEKEK
ncbi:MAG: hypothetical protein IJS74_01535 [Clostridia bacterium]|nr:hypothetical protein [Clostridia bacterium]